MLQAAGGELDDLLKITTYITNIDDFPAVVEIRSSFFSDTLPASTLIVVSCLAQPELLIEVEGMAAIG
jgi:enamine deaminase RidA (YjgF/YER057c/UK114 family)